jgi:hypothetical protein
MPSVRQIAEEIVAREGGFVNDPDDPGGATNHGVTIHTMRRLGLDLDGDGSIGAGDLSILLGGFGTGEGDVDGNGITDARDLGFLLASFGVSCG